MKRSDYERRADEAVSSFINDGHSLEESIVKIAHRDRLNPEQIKRVIEMANTGTFLKLFSLKDGPDKVVDFEVADPKKTLDRFYAKGSAESEDDDTSDSADDAYHCAVDDENRPKDIGDAADEEKTASVKSKADIRRESRNKDENVVRMWKVAESLKDRIAKSEYDASDIADSLAVKFRGIYGREKYAEFEKNALALHGPPAVVAFNAIRGRLKLKEYKRLPNSELVKEASDKYVVDGGTPEMARVGDYLSCVQDYQKCQRALSTLG